MTHQLPEFRGLAPWPSNIEVVECVVGARAFDLHNQCTLMDVVTTCTPEVELRFRFVEDDTGQRFEVRFIGVEELAFGQDDRASGLRAWNPNEVETFIGAEYSVPMEGRPRFTVETIVGKYAFSCVGVEFVLMT